METWLGAQLTCGLSVGGSNAVGTRGKASRAHTRHTRHRGHNTGKSNIHNILALKFGGASVLEFLKLMWLNT